MSPCRPSVSRDFDNKHVSTQTKFPAGDQAYIRPIEALNTTPVLTPCAGGQFRKTRYAQARECGCVAGFGLFFRQLLPRRGNAIRRMAVTHFAALAQGYRRPGGNATPGFRRAPDLQRGFCEFADDSDLRHVVTKFLRGSPCRTGQFMSLVVTAFAAAPELYVPRPNCVACGNACRAPVCSQANADTCGGVRACGNIFRRQKPSRSGFCGNKSRASRRTALWL